VGGTVSVLEYKAIALRREARRRRIDTSEIINDAIDVGWCEAQSIDKQVPGYLAAWHFPYPLSRADDYRAVADRRGPALGREYFERSCE
jgi:hypothetical protein